MKVGLKQRWHQPKKNKNKNKLENLALYGLTCFADKMLKPILQKNSSS